MGDRPIVIAHRAFHKKNLEELRLLVSKLAKYKIKGIEIDTQLSSQGIPIIAHDYLLDNKKAYPTLSDFLEIVDKKTRIEIEIKGYEKNVVTKIIEIVQKSGIKNYEITSAEAPVVSLVVKLLPNSDVGIMIRHSHFSKWMTDEHKKRLILGYLELTGANVLHLDLTDYSPDLIKSLKKLGIKIHTLLSNSKRSNLKKINDLKIDFCSVTSLRIAELILSNK